MMPDRHLPSACPDAPVLGTAGEITVESSTFGWRWENGWSVGDTFTMQVPDDLTGLTLAVVDGSAWTGVSFVASNGSTLIDTDVNDPGLEGLVAPYFHIPIPAGAVTFPMSGDSAVAPGCLSVVPAGLEDLTAGEGTLHFISRRRPAGGTIDINAVVVGATSITMAEVDATFAIVDEVFSAAGSPALSVVEVQALSWPSVYFNCEGADINELRSQRFGADEGRLNVFFVQDFNELGTLGFAAGIPGPNGVHGTASSGLVISVDTHLDGAGAVIDTVLMGETIAHEIGHQLGLFHTTEYDAGYFDVLPDTPQCDTSNDTNGDGELAAEECLAFDAENLMFWTSGDGIRQRMLSPTQVQVLSLAPVAR